MGWWKPVPQTWGERRKIGRGLAIPIFPAVEK